MHLLYGKTIVFSNKTWGFQSPIGCFSPAKTGMILNDPLRSATMKAVALGTSEISKVHNSQATRSSSIAGDLYRKQGPVMWSLVYKPLIPMKSSSLYLWQLNASLTGGPILDVFHRVMEFRFEVQIRDGSDQPKRASAPVGLPAATCILMKRKHGNGKQLIMGKWCNEKQTSPCSHMFFA